MKLNDAKSIFIGQEPVKAVYLGEQLIWPTGKPEPSLPEGYERADALETIQIYNPFLAYGVYVPYVPTPHTKFVIDLMYLPDAMSYNDEPYTYSSNAVYTVVYGVTSALLYDVSGLYRYAKSMVYFRKPKVQQFSADAVEAGVRYTLIAENNLVRFVPENQEKETVEIDTQMDIPTNYNVTGVWFMGIEAKGDPFYGRVYSIKIYEDGKQVMNLVPARKLYPDYGGAANVWIAGFYDTMHDQWYQAKERVTMDVIMQE